MIVAINYANKKFQKTQKFNSKTAVHKGGVDKVISYSPKDIDALFWEKNRRILEKKRGNGYWLWKPYFIYRTLDKMQYGDYLVYLDSGAFYIDDVRHLIRKMDSDGQDIMAFELSFKERCYTKRDVFIAMGCDEPRFSETNMRMATMVVMKKTETVLEFVREWLHFCQDEHLITDERNSTGRKNYEGFIENRHDQSIFSLLSKKYGFKPYRDPSQFGRFMAVGRGVKTDKMKIRSEYTQIIALHRMSEVTKHVFWEQMMFAYAPMAVVKAYLLYWK